MARKLDDWVGAFERSLGSANVPKRLCRWGAIACLAGAMERKVWVHTAGSDLYPNLYIFLVSPPGVGKSRVLSAVRAMWASLVDHHLAPTNASRASLIDALDAAQRTIIRAGHVPASFEFNSLKVLISELGVFLPEFANEFMNTLTDLYDGTPYMEKKRSMKVHIDLPKPQLNIIAGTTPSYLGGLLPDGAWDQGFMSRTLLIHDAQISRVSLFSASTVDKETIRSLQSDLAELGEVIGEMRFTEEAKNAIDAWYLGGCKPEPDHPKLTNYLTRRAAHVLKLSMVASISESNNLVIDLPHFLRAKEWLEEAEAHIPDIFKGMGGSADSKVMDECWHLCMTYQVREQKLLSEASVIKFLQSRVPSYAVEKVLELMVKSHMLEQGAVKNVGVVYKALPRS